jgi:insertion element IS1 protein InsB
MNYLRSLSFRTNICGFKKNKIWLWTAVNSHQAGVLKWVIGDRSQKTFRDLWWVVRGWCCFLYITDGYPVYPCFINDGDHLVSKTAMTRVEGENSRLRHYLARLHRKTFCYSKSIEMLEASIRLLTYYLKHWTVPIF